MKMMSAMLAMLILMNMVCTIAYLDHANFQGIMAHETRLLTNSDRSNDGTSLIGAMTLGRKLMTRSSTDSIGVSTDSSHVVSVNEYNNFISHIHRP
ncbi:hypothetical protein BS78_06G034700 [Paspalum vaginatum]|nr:hypothetical protein BS78_06G034700 [Paspalum vaginatum]KAJ1270180.1 hypothetical protein BS78_06G034700 [Paspalum vaginatum]KAJ1270181.1 hypothetical protein BS78_06G034700 [Paspalum vaginatum]KAJ1270182.1 hypothetical protein BS78_06G034700 [Paspalum vaginatum]